MLQNEVKKACPACAEQIQSAAVICRHCGYDYQAGIVSRQNQTTQVIQQKTNGTAIASMVLGILWLYWIGSALALMFGYRAKREIADSNGLQGGSGMATAGIVLGWIGMGFFALLIVGVLVSLSGG